MDTVKQIRRRLAGGALALAVSAGTAIAADVTLRLAHVAPPTSSYQDAANLFKKHLKALSGDKMDVQIIPGGALGNLVQLWAQLRAGTLDMHLIDVGAIAPVKPARSFALLSMPYLFRDQAHFHAFLESDIFRQMMGDATKEIGIRYVGYLGDRPPRALSTRNKAVKVPADLKGLKIRTPLNPAITGVFKVWGASPTPLRGSQIFTALQSGLVEGQDNGIVDIVAAGWLPVQNYYSSINYMHSGIGVWMSGRKWAALSDEQKKWVTDAADKTFAVNRLLFPKQVEEAIAKAKAAGMTFVEPDRAAFAKAARPMIDKLDGKLWPKGLYDRIRQIK